MTIFKLILSDDIDICSRQCVDVFSTPSVFSERQLHQVMERAEVHLQGDQVGLR